MTNKVFYTPMALRDIEEIAEYIAVELENPGAAKRIVLEIQDHIDSLEDFPYLGSLLSSIAQVNSDYRFLVTGSYLTFYRILGETVYIDRVLYGKRDYLRILFPEC